VVLMSPHAHARIKLVDATGPNAADGVICLLTGVDIIADRLGCMPPLFMPVWRTARLPDLPASSRYRTRSLCRSGRVPFVVAETLEQAQSAPS
jgi:carbon-monoxide dehydrogenase large subunit